MSSKEENIPVIAETIPEFNKNYSTRTIYNELINKNYTTDKAIAEMCHKFDIFCNNTSNISYLLNRYTEFYNHSLITKPNVLSSEGVSFTDYITQLTYILFLKMDEKKEELELGSSIPEGYKWNDLFKLNGDDLVDKYEEILKDLSKDDSLSELSTQERKQKSRTFLKIALFSVRITLFLL